MSKDYIHIKANGIRNELKEIRKAVDKLTAAMIEIHLAQTNNQNESTKRICTCDSGGVQYDERLQADAADGIQYDYD